MFRVKRAKREVLLTFHQKFPAYIFRNVAIISNYNYNANASVARKINVNPFMLTGHSNGGMI